MTRTRLLSAATTIAALALATAPAMAQTKFEFWYGLSGDLSDRIQDMCKTFNESRSNSLRAAGKVKEGATDKKPGVVGIAVGDPGAPSDKASSAKK